MPSFHEALGLLMLDHPLIYPEPLDATVALFNARDGDYLWVGGQLTNKAGVRQEGQAVAMDYSDLDAQEQTLGRMQARGMNPRDMDIQHKLALARRAMVEENILFIAQADPTATYFRRPFDLPPSLRDLIGGKTADKPPFLSFPDNIAPDWGHALSKLHSFLLLAMQSEFGSSISGEIHHWPEPAQLLHAKIMVAVERLHPLLHAGQSYQDFIEHNQDLSERLVGQMMAEEASEAANPPRARAAV